MPAAARAMWVILTLICALSLATADALTKRTLRDGAEERLVGWLRLIFTVPPLLLILFFIDIPEIGPAFYTAMAASLPLEILAFVLYIKALRVSPMSLSLPFLAFTPVFVIGVSYLIVGEEPSLLGAWGILLIAAGGYVLNLRRFKYGALEPIKAVFKERGSMMMLAVAFIYSFTASLVKLGINHSSPLFFGVVYFSILPLAYTPFALPALLKRGTITRRDLSGMALAGFFTAAMVITHVIAVSLTHVAYMVAVKRTSLLFSVLYGCLLFREGHLRERTAGALMMFIGFVVVVTAG
jgi:drug/metabolite transporter (DMT)-like permease